MSDVSEVLLWDRLNKRLTDATLYDELTLAQVASAAASWQPLIDERVAVFQQQSGPVKDWPQHAHWDWNRKANMVSGLLAYQLLGVECEGQMQGLMLTGTVGQCRINTQAGKPLVVVHFLTTAPWNLPSFVSQPRFGLVGKVLIAAAVQLSVGTRNRLINRVYSLYSK